MTDVDPPRAVPGRALAAVVVVGTLVLAACGSPSGSGDGPGRAVDGAPAELPECPLEALGEADGPVEVDLWFGGLVEPPVGVLEGLVEDFNASQDQVVVTANNQGTAYQEVLRQYERTASNPDQLPQILYLEDIALGQLVDRGQVLPAQSCMEADGYDLDDLVPAARASFEVDGVLYPGYMNVSTPILYYNQSHFQAAGLDPNRPPETLEEVEEAARRIEEAGVSPTPLAFRADQWFFTSWLVGLGEEVVDNDDGRAAPPTEARLDTPAARDLVQWLDDLDEEGLLNPFPVTEAGIDHYLALVTEQSSMLVETSVASGTIAQALGGGLGAEDVGADIDASVLETVSLVPGSGPLPGIEEPGRAFAAGGAFYILNTASPAQQAASWRFLRFMLEPENARTWYLEGGYLPVVADLLDDPAVRAFQETDLAGLLLAPSAAQLAATDLTGPLIGPYGAYTDAVQGAMERVLFGGEDPATALGRAQDEVDQALEDHNA